MLDAGCDEESADALWFLHATSVSEMVVRISAFLTMPNTCSPLMHLRLFIACIYSLLD